MKLLLGFLNFIKPWPTSIKLKSSHPAMVSGGLYALLIIGMVCLFCLAIHWVDALSTWVSPRYTIEQMKYHTTSEITMQFMIEVVVFVIGEIYVMLLFYRIWKLCSSWIDNLERRMLSKLKED